jgi:polar amino acid transport system substrate-binding protein
MKKLIAFALAIISLLGIFAGCEKVEQNVGGNKYNLTTVTPGVLTVATSPDYAPFEFYSFDENGKPYLAGFDIALAQYIADYLDLELKIVPMDFDGTISELGNKMCDLSMAGYSADPDRLIYMDFSDVYYTSEQAFVTVSSKADKFTDLASANKEDIKVGVQMASIQADLAAENTPNANIITLTKVTDIIAELVSGKLDGAFIETPVVEAYKNNYPELQIVCTVPQEDNGSVLGVYKGNADLLMYVNEAIAAANADGSFAKFVAEAVDLAAGEKHEGLLDEEGNIPNE